MLVLNDVAGAIGSNSCRVSRLHFIWTQHEKKKSETAIKTIFLSTAEKRNRRVVVTKEDTRRVLDGYPLLVCVLLSVVFLLCMVIMFKWVAEKENVLTESMVSFIPSAYNFFSICLIM